MTDKAELARVADVVNEYFVGMYEGDTDRLQAAFHPAACLFGHNKGRFTHLSLSQWLDIVRQRPRPSANGERFDMKIVAIDITGAVAAVKVRDFYQGLWFTDYLSLVRDQDKWLIVNKSYHHD